jgi:hypothetical protein
MFKQKMDANQNNLHILINERNQFEDNLYDNLNLNEVNRLNGIVELNDLDELDELDDLEIFNLNQNNVFHLNRIVFRYTEDPSFWDPVIVNLSIQQIDRLEYIYNTVPVECIICNENKHDFKKVSCCNNNVCVDCTNKWFNLSVYCPFCKKDQRELI